MSFSSWEVVFTHFTDEDSGGIFHQETVKHPLYVLALGGMPGT